jgi:leucyl aminopeptidase
MPVLELSSQTGKDFSGDVLVVPVFSGRERHRLPLAVSKVARQAMDEGDFKAEYLECVPLHHPNGVKDCRWMLLVGLGDEETITPNRLRKAVGAALRQCLKKGWARAGIVVPSTSGMGHDEVQGVVLEGALLADYDFVACKGKPAPRRLERLELFTNGEDTRKARRRLPQIEVGVAACHRVRDLVNTPAGELHPEAFAAMAQKLAKQHKIGVEVLGPEELEKGGFGCVLAVGGGSVHAPRVVKLDYKPKDARRHVALVGKGVCFDAGGLSLKPANSMETMKDDMAGAAVVLATLVACAELQLPVRVTGILGLVENMPSGSAYRPGDVLRSRSGKTVEVLNTDAEGRLVLADLLHYASGLEPDHLVDLATLTGAGMVALGDGVSGVFGTDQRLVDRLLDAGLAAGEHLWQLPLVEEYRASLRSHVADLKNVSGGRWGGAITAALFLRDFVEVPSWAHVDLSSAWSASERDFRPFGGTGEGPRWLLEWLMA